MRNIKWPCARGAGRIAEPRIPVPKQRVVAKRVDRLWPGWWLRARRRGTCPRRCRRVLPSGGGPHRLAPTGTHMARPHHRRTQHQGQNQHEGRDCDDHAAAGPARWPPIGHRRRIHRPRGRHTISGRGLGNGISGKYRAGRRQPTARRWHHLGAGRRWQRYTPRRYGSGLVVRRWPHLVPPTHSVNAGQHIDTHLGLPPWER